MEIDRGAEDMEIRTQLTVMGHRMDMIDKAFKRAKTRQKGTSQ